MKYQDLRIHKKIIFFIDSPGYGGSEINAINLIDTLKDHFKIELVLNQYHCIEIVEYAKLNVIPIHFFNVANNQINFFKGMFYANRILNKFKNELVIIWCHHIDSNRWIQFCSALKGIKYIIVEQLIPTELSDLKKSRLTIPIKKYVCSHSFTNVICAYSQEANYSKFFSTNRITVIPNTRNILKIKKNILEYKQRFIPKFPLNGICIVSIGRLAEQKDPVTLINAVNMLKNKYVITLILVGDGELMNFVKTTINTYLMENVILIGHDELPLKWLAHADIFILNSTSEGLPGALIEAMASSVTCIATDIPGNRELIINNKTGLSIPIKNEISLAKAISFLIENPDKSKLYAENGFEHVIKNYDFEIERNLWTALLKKVYEN